MIVIILLPPSIRPERIIKNLHRRLNAITPPQVYEMQMTIIGTYCQCKGKQEEDTKQYLGLT